MQKVEIYSSMYDAKREMEKHIRSGWRVHICVMNSYMTGYHFNQDVLVVYEK